MMNCEEMIESKVHEFSIKPNQWLNEAKELDFYHNSGIAEFKALKDRIFDEICNRGPIYKKNRMKETLRMILLNLWLADLCGFPIMYSRSPNQYSHNTRYNLLFYKYNLVIKVTDTLEAMGYIQQRNGYFNREDGIKRRTRAFATDRLIDLFAEYLPTDFGIVHRDPPKEIIQLKNSKKILIGYDTDERTVQMRILLHRYNQFIQNQEITVEIPVDMPIKLEFLKDLKFNLLRGVASVKDFVWLPPSIQPNNNKSILTHLYNNLHNHNNHHNYNHIYTIISTITNKDLVNRLDVVREVNGKKMIILKDLGIGRLVLGLEYEQLHRVFNQSSFEKGGRFYGAFHLSLGKELRPFIRINGDPVVELDYSALHIRMLYHSVGIDYREDPYSILCDREEDRGIYKLVQLVSINAENEGKAIKAIRNEFRKEGYYNHLTDKAIIGLINRFKRAHKPIQNFLNAGVGLDLQNRDSAITEQILTHFYECGIPVLPVHDSYIITSNYSGTLADTMNSYYERDFGFQPVVK